MTLAAQELSFGFRTPVLRDVFISFQPGRIALILGPNGSGKTTLLRLLLGLLEPGPSPRGGSCSIAGTPVRSLTPERRAAHLAYIPHHPHVGYAYTVRQYVGFSQAIRPPDSGAVEAALVRLEIEPLADTPLVELSAGQTQRASIARALAQITGSDACPRFLLADEPTSALDPRHVARVLALFRRLAAEGVGIVMTMHDLATADSIADHVCLLSAQGRIAAQGPPHTVLLPEVLEGVFHTGFGLIEAHGRRVLVRNDSPPALIP